MPPLPCPRPARPGPLARARGLSTQPPLDVGSRFEGAVPRLGRRDCWENGGHDPLRVLEGITVERSGRARRRSRRGRRAASDRGARLEEALTVAALVPGRAEQPAAPRRLLLPEFGISEAVPQYLGRPRHPRRRPPRGGQRPGRPARRASACSTAEGYFRQRLNPDGWQQEQLPRPRRRRWPAAHAERPASHASASTSTATDRRGPGLEGRRRAHPSLYLLDADVDRQRPRTAARSTDRLYGGDAAAPPAPGDRARHRRRAGPAPLGINAAGVPHATRATPASSAWSASASSSANGLSFQAEAIEGVAWRAASSPHTPVPAGIDRFSPRADGASTSPASPPSCGVTFDELMRARPAASDEPDDDASTWRCMGLRLAGPRERRGRPARRGQPRRCSRACGRTSPSTRCRSARSPTACTAHLGVGPSMTGCSTSTSPEDWDGADDG